MPSMPAETVCYSCGHSMGAHTAVAMMAGLGKCSIPSCPCLIYRDTKKERERLVTNEQLCQCEHLRGVHRPEANQACLMCACIGFIHASQELVDMHNERLAIMHDVTFGVHDQGVGLTFTMSMSESESAFWFLDTEQSVQVFKDGDIASVSQLEGAPCIVNVGTPNMTKFVRLAKIGRFRGRSRG